jgi:hypothetical protein
MSKHPQLGKEVRVPLWATKPSSGSEQQPQQGSAYEVDSTFTMRVFYDCCKVLKEGQGITSRGAGLVSKQLSQALQCADREITEGCLPALQQLFLLDAKAAAGKQLSKKKKLRKQRESPLPSLRKLQQSLLQAGQALFVLSCSSSSCCSNPSCTNLGTVSDAFALVCGKECVCAGCLSQASGVAGADTGALAARWVCATGDLVKTVSCPVASARDFVVCLITWNSL